MYNRFFLSMIHWFELHAGGIYPRFLPNKGSSVMRPGSTLALGYVEMCTVNEKMRVCEVL